MEICLRSVVFVCCLLSVRGAGDVKNLTFCTNAYIPTTTLCTQEDTVIQVMDVYVYDFLGREYYEGPRGCLYQHGDNGAPLIDVSSGAFNDMVRRCDARQACLSWWVPVTRLTDGSNSNYIVMNYTCVRKVPTMTIYGRVGRTFERTSCGDNAVLHVVGVYAGYSPDDCTRTWSWRHVDGDYFRIVKSGCEQNNCVDLRSRGYQRRCNNRYVQSVWVAIIYRCNILPDDETTHPTTPVPTTPVPTTTVPTTPVLTTPVRTTPVITTLSNTKSTAGSPATLTSPRDSSRTPADPSTTDVITGGPGIDGQEDTGGEMSGGSDVGNEIDVIVGVCVATLAAIVLAVLTFICVRRKKNSRPGTTTPAYTNPAYSGQVVDSPVRSSPSAVENIYNDGDEDYSVVGPAVGGQLLGGPALGPLAFGAQDLGGQPVRDAGQHDDAVYYNVLAPEDQHSADYSLATGINEYSEVNKRHSEADDLEIQDNVNYQAGDFMAAVDEQVTRQSPEVNDTDTELVDNAQYAQWQDTVKPADGNDENIEDTIVDDPQYDNWAR